MTKKIMVVDDEEDVRLSIKEVLLAKGFKAYTAESADDCLKKVNHEKPDLILLDIMMPGMPVKEMIPQLNPSIKVVFLTVVKYLSVEEEGLMEFDSVVGYIPKPFEINDLVRQIKKFVN